MCDVKIDEVASEGRASLQLVNLELSAVPGRALELTQLTQLNLSANALCTLPEGLSKLRNLIDLDVSRNRLSELPRCTSITYFSVYTVCSCEPSFACTSNADNDSAMSQGVALKHAAVALDWSCSSTIRCCAAPLVSCPAFSS